MRKPRDLRCVLCSCLPTWLYSSPTPKMLTTPQRPPFGWPRRRHSSGATWLSSFTAHSSALQKWPTTFRSCCSCTSWHTSITNGSVHSHYKPSSAVWVSIFLMELATVMETYSLERWGILTVTLVTIKITFKHKIPQIHMYKIPHIHICKTLFIVTPTLQNWVSFWSSWCFGCLCFLPISTLNSTSGWSTTQASFSTNATTFSTTKHTPLFCMRNSLSSRRPWTSKSTTKSCKSKGRCSRSFQSTISMNDRRMWNLTSKRSCGTWKPK